MKFYILWFYTAVSFSKDVPSGLNIVDPNLKIQKKEAAEI